jgi:hypothetical protein
MEAKKGQRFGGRAKGTPNKNTAIVKETIRKILDEYYSSGELAKDMADLSSKERLDAIIKLTSFIVPKPQVIEMTSDATRTIEDKLRELSGEDD